MGGVDRVEPGQCSVLLGLALDLKSHAAERGIEGSWGHLLRHQPNDAFVIHAGHALDVLRSARSLGARVPSPRLRAFKPIDIDKVRTEAKHARVLAFVTHHDRARGFQLGDRLVALSELVGAIGREYNGVIDLSACDTKHDVVDELRAGVPEARWVICDGRIGLNVRMSVLRVVLRVLAGRPARYIDVLSQTLQEMQLPRKEYSL